MPNSSSDWISQGALALWMSQWYFYLCAGVLSHFSRVNTMDCSLPGSTVLGILQARILEWVAMSSSGDLPNPGIEPASLTALVSAVSLPLAPPGKPDTSIRELNGKSWNSSMVWAEWMRFNFSSPGPSLLIFRHIWSLPLHWETLLTKPLTKRWIQKAQL